MKAQIHKEDIFVRKADSQGRVSLPSKKYKGKKLEIAVLDEIEEEDWSAMAILNECEFCGAEFWDYPRRLCPGCRDWVEDTFGDNPEIK